MRTISTHQHRDEQGSAYAKDEGCLHKCWWTQDQSEVVALCPYYDLIQVGDTMRETCTDPCEW
jgi:hypothetical protein